MYFEFENSQFPGLAPRISQLAQLKYQLSIYIFHSSQILTYFLILYF